MFLKSPDLLPNTSPNLGREINNKVFLGRSHFFLAGKEAPSWMSKKSVPAKQDEMGCETLGLLMFVIMNCRISVSATCSTFNSTSISLCGPYIPGE